MVQRRGREAERNFPPRSGRIVSSRYTDRPRSTIANRLLAPNDRSAGIAQQIALRVAEVPSIIFPLGGELRQQLADILSGYEMVREVRGKGLLLGIEFASPLRLTLRAPFEAFAQIHPAMFGQILVMRLFRNANILTQICGNDFMVLKVAPPLVITSEQVTEFVSAVHDVVDFAHHPGAFWSEALGLARRAVGA